MENENQIKDSLKQWVLQVSIKAKDTEIGFNTDLLQSRIITSLQIMELILEIEKLKGQSINIKNIKPGSFSTIDSIYKAFFEGAN